MLSNNKGMTFWGLICLIGMISLAVYALSPIAKTFISDSKKSLFMTAAVAGFSTIKVDEVYNYDKQNYDEAKLYSFTELEIRNFDYKNYDINNSYIIAVKNGKESTTFTYYVSFKTQNDVKNYFQIVLTKREDISPKNISSSKEGWIPKPIIGSKITIEGKEYTVIN